MAEYGISICTYSPKIRHEILAYLSCMTNIIMLLSNTDIFEYGDFIVIIFMITSFSVSILEYSVLNIIISKLIHRTTSIVSIVNGKVYVHRWFKEVELLSIRKYDMSEFSRFLYNFDGETLLRLRFSDGSVAYIEDDEYTLYNEIISRINRVQ